MGTEEVGLTGVHWIQIATKIYLRISSFVYEKTFMLIDVQMNLHNLYLKQVED